MVLHVNVVKAASATKVVVQTCLKVWLKREGHKNQVFDRIPLK